MNPYELKTFLEMHETILDLKKQIESKDHTIRILNEMLDMLEEKVTPDVNLPESYWKAVFDEIEEDTLIQDGPHTVVVNPNNKPLAEDFIPSVPVAPQKEPVIKHSDCDKADEDHFKVLPKRFFE